MQANYTDGFFDVSAESGFLPIQDPLVKLPEAYQDAQSIIDELPALIQDQSKLDARIQALRVYDPSHETDPFVIQALFRAYTFMSSAYLLAPSYHGQKNGIYGKARNVLPTPLAKPLVCVADKLQVSPFLEYHYAYSLGNYVKKDDSKGLHWSNLGMACSFTGGQDETGFIMNHVYINEVSPDLVRSIHFYLDGQELEGVKLFYETMVEINNRRKTMWQASNHKNYNQFRAFIMGIKGNDDIFGPGVQYKAEDGRDEEFRQYRGQTGAQDDIIPTADIFADVVAYYPQNQLTSYLMDLREYRPKCVQAFFKDLQKDMSNKPMRAFFENNQPEGLVYLLAAIEQIYLFRNGHWQFVQKYIMANTRYPKATGGTPIISWLPNQIEACLQAMGDLIQAISSVSFTNATEELFASIKNGYPNKVKLLEQQLDELKNENYNVDRIYELNIAQGLDDQA